MEGLWTRGGIAPPGRFVKKLSRRSPAGRDAGEISEVRRRDDGRGFTTPTGGSDFAVPEPRGCPRAISFSDGAIISGLYSDILTKVEAPLARAVSATPRPVTRRIDRHYRFVRRDTRPLEGHARLQSLHL
jgi:hypothetical protein